MIYLDPRGLRKYEIAGAGSAYGGSRWPTTGRYCRGGFGSVRRNLDYDKDGRDVLYPGTTGKPKGVVLEQPQLSRRRNHPPSSTTCVSRMIFWLYLPMAWVGDFCLSVGQVMWDRVLHHPESGYDARDLRET
jgi:hypothetical protein